MFTKVSLVLVLSVVAHGQRFARDTGYGAPEPSYSAPEPSYGAPEPAYGAPEAVYEEPAYSAPDEAFDITSLIIPVLALVGLMLLFPTYTTLTSVRRSFKDNGPLDLMKKVHDVYQAVVEDSDILTKYD